MYPFLIYFSMLLVVFITLLIILLIVVSFYNLYLVFKYLSTQYPSSRNENSKKETLINKIKKGISIILYYSIGKGYGESIKIYESLFVLDDNTQGEIFYEFKCNVKKLTSIMYKIIVTILILIFLLVYIALFS